MKFHILTLFPEMIYGGLNHSIIRRAAEKGLIGINCIDIRDFADNKHRRVDDYPYGGGCGMVMQAEPVYMAFQSIKHKLPDNTKVLFMSPQGKTLNQKMVEKLSQEKNLVILCGHYEGIDERVIEEIVTDEISIGDYVLTGGEPAAIVLVDCVARLIPGVLNKEDSQKFESFSDGLLEYPQYTRPPAWRGKEIPEVLVSGHHANVEKWRNEKSLERTNLKRPDLLKH